MAVEHPGRVGDR